MSTPRRVFRPVALQRHEVAARRTVVSDVVAPRIARWLCVLLALLTLVAAVVATARVPVVAVGWAVVDAAPGEAATDAYMVVLLEPSETGRLRVGQPVTLEFPGIGPLERAVATVVPGMLDPEAAGRRWPSIPVGAIVGTAPRAVVLVPLASTGDDWISVANAGGVGRAEVEVGSRSIGSLLPLVGRLFGG